MSKVENTLKDAFRNHLKTVTLETLEEAIAKAVGDLIGKELRCSISSIDYLSSHSRTNAKFDVSLSEPLDKMFGYSTSGTTSPAANTPQSDEQ